MNLVSFVKRNHKLLFYTGWIAMNTIQAAATELLDDEAYYWVYSRFPDWGFFDHPPMIALFIKAGTLFLPGELGVRALIVIINIATLYIIQQLIERKNDLLFYGIVLSVAIAQIGGIIAAPDLPVLFFTALFFLVYRRFTQNMNFLNTVLLGVITALMMYSKYHGVLILLFTMLSNLKLFTKYQTYVAAFLALVCFAPHLYWQYTHYFPSVEYHLFERSAESYQVRYTIEYIFGQVLLAGPIIGWLLLWTAFKYKPLSDTERALRFTMIGFYIFFLISTIKGRVEANWTMQVIVALLVLSHQYLFGRPALQKWVYNTVPVTLALVLMFRVYIVMDVNGVSWLKGDEFHQNKVWSALLREQSKGLPLVAINSYQKASKYWFYSGIPAYSHNTPDYRRNNFNFWPISDSLLGKTVYVTGKYDSLVLNEKIHATGFENNGGKIIDSFYSFSQIQFRDISNIHADNASVSLSSKIIIPENYFSYFRQSPYNEATVQLAVIQKDSAAKYYNGNLSVKQISQTVMDCRLIFPAKLDKGVYKARLAVSSRIPDKPSLNSASFRIKVE